MIKIFVPFHYALLTIIGFSIVILLSGFSYKSIAKKTDDKSASKANFYDLKAISIDGEEVSFEKERVSAQFLLNNSTAPIS